jgi:hypothetical protein
MASVVTAAPSDGAPLLALHKLDKHFGTAHALKVVIGKGLNYGVKLFIFDEPMVPWTSAPKRKSTGCWPPCRISTTPCTSFGRADSSQARDTKTLPRK